MYILCLYAGLFRWAYERFRLPVAPIYGGFPVKFRTFLGDPIPYDPNVNAAELAEKVSKLQLSHCFFLSSLYVPVCVCLSISISICLSVKILTDRHGYRYGDG